MTAVRPRGRAYPGPYRTCAQEAEVSAQPAEVSGIRQAYPMR